MAREIGKPAGELKKAIRDVRMAMAERGDVVVEMREAEHARLALLAEALVGIFDGLPADQEQFSLAVLPGDPPRLWVDATSFVVMGRDKRTYQFVKDTRLGRTVLAEGANQDAIAGAVTRYVAERFVEREQAMEADWVTALLRKQRGETLRRAPMLADSRFAWITAGFAFGLLAGILLVFLAAWVMVD
jgi:hypothetical protein